MDLLSLLTGSENLYKYLFIGGLGMIVLSLFYPLNKKYEYVCQKDFYNNEVKLLNTDIHNIDSVSTDLHKSFGEMKKSILNSQNEKIKRILKDSFNRQYDSVISFRKQIEKKRLELEYSNVRIKSLDNHISDFTKYETLFFISGILFSISGIIGWFLLMIKAPGRSNPRGHEEPSRH